jgi:transposase-like protein
MDKQQRQKFSPEVRARAVRMVIEHRGDHASQWAAIVSIAAKIGCTAQTLRTWVVQAERDQGRRAGSTTDERERIKRWNARTASFARPMRFCARPQRILPRRSSTAGSGHDRLH